MKLATVFGAFSASSLRVMSPWLVVSLTCDMSESLLFGNDFDVLNDDRGGWHVFVIAKVAGWHLGDLVDDVHALNDLAEHGVAPGATVGRRTVVEEGVVLQVDEELDTGGMRIL